MQKYIAIIMVSILLIFGISFFDSDVALAAGSKTVKWGKVHYQPNFIGKIVLKKNTNTYKIKKGKLVKGKLLKKGSEEGVTAITKSCGGLYQIGKGIYIKKATSVTYVSISKSPAGDLKFEKGFVEALNKERKRNGLKPLIINTKLSQAAKVKTADMLLKKTYNYSSKDLGNTENILKNYGVKYIKYLAIIDKDHDTLGSTPQKTLQNHLKVAWAKQQYLSYLYDEIGVGYIHHPKLGSKLTVFLIQTKEKRDPNLVSVSTYKKLPKIDYAHAVEQPIMNAYSVMFDLNQAKLKSLLNGRIKYIVYNSKTSPITYINKSEFKYASDATNTSAIGTRDLKKNKFYAFFIYLDKNRKPIGYEEETYTATKVVPKLAANYKAFSSPESIGISFTTDGGYLNIESKNSNDPYKYYTVHFSDKKMPIKDILSKEESEILTYGHGGIGMKPDLRFNKNQKFYTTVIVYDQYYNAVGSFTKEYLVNNF